MTFSETNKATKRTGGEQNLKKEQVSNAEQFS